MIAMVDQGSIGTVSNGARSEAMVRLASGSALALGVQPAGFGADAQTFAFALVIVLLCVGCVMLTRSRKKDRQEAETERARHARQIDELLHMQQLRIQEAVERGSLRERERADNDLKERMNVLLSTVSDGVADLAERLDTVDRRQREREVSVRARLDEAMTDLRRAGRASIRFVLERFGLADALEDLRWTLESAGRMHVALQVQGLGPVFGRGEQTVIYHLVNDAVDALMGYEGVDRLDIRLERTNGKCRLSVENNGGEAVHDQRRARDGRLRLEASVTQLRGSLEGGRLPQGGHTVNVEIPLMP